MTQRIDLQAKQTQKITNSTVAIELTLTKTEIYAVSQRIDIYD